MRNSMEISFFSLFFYDSLAPPLTEKHGGQIFPRATKNYFLFFLKKQTLGKREVFFLRLLPLNDSVSHLTSFNRIFLETQ